MKTLKPKLRGANGLFAKARYYLLPYLPKTLHFSIFESHDRYDVRYGYDTENLQCKAIKIINCKSKYAKYIFFNTKIMSVPDIVEPENSSLTE